jgi:type II secretory ATPase GspE/PulE/Tfp pilus assembly ATPase PilB-like protein
MAGTTTKKRSKVEVITVNGEAWKPEDLAEATGLTVSTVKTTPPEALAGILDQKRKAEQAKAELEKSKKESKSKAPRVKKEKVAQPTPRANKARKLMDGQQDEEDSWTDIIMEILIEDPTRSASDLHRIAGYHSISNKNTYTPEINGAKRTIGALYRAGLLDAEMERRLHLAATETK